MLDSHRIKGNSDMILLCTILTTLSYYITAATEINTVAIQKENLNDVSYIKDIITSRNTEIGLNFLRALSGSPTIEALTSVTEVVAKNSKTPSANGRDVIFSPIGLLKSLYILATGARDKTQVDLLELLVGGVIPDHPDQKFLRKYNEGFKVLQDVIKGHAINGDDLSSHDEKSPEQTISHQNFTIKWVSKVYVDDNFDPKHDFQESLKKFYDTESESLDFRTGDSRVSRKIINEWISKATAHKIKNAISEPVPDALTKMLILNVFYFKGNWEVPFDSNLTVRNESFYAAHSQSIVGVEMMHNPRIHLKLNFLEDINVQYIELPFVTKKVSMYIVLPLDNDGLSSVLARITPHHIEVMTNGTETTIVDLKLPKIRVTSNLDAKKYLKKLGLKSIFDPGSADFSGISDSSDLYVSEFRQTSAIEMTEQGAEVAAVTSVEISERSGPYTFSADHPFLYFMYDNEARAILFIGTVWDPTKLGSSVTELGAGTKKKKVGMKEPSQRDILNREILKAIKEINMTLAKRGPAIAKVDDGGRSVGENDRREKTEDFTMGYPVLDPEFLPYVDPEILKELNNLINVILRGNRTET